MNNDISYFLEKTGITTPVVAFYDAPDPEIFAPLVNSKNLGKACVFCFYKKWQKGETLVLHKDNHGCPGAGMHLFDIKPPTKEAYVNFLTDNEGLKENHELCEEWVDTFKDYNPENEYLLYGPFKKELASYAKGVTFFVNPDQLSMLITAAQYFSKQSDADPVIAHFHSGCMQSIAMFEDLTIPQAIIGATDIAMRKYLPPEILAFTVTMPMYERLCSLDDKSFLTKSFLAGLMRSREKAGGEK